MSILYAHRWLIHPKEVPKLPDADIDSLIDWLEKNIDPLSLQCDQIHGLWLALSKWTNFYADSEIEHMLPFYYKDIKTQLPIKLGEARKDSGIKGKIPEWATWGDMQKALSKNGASDDRTERMARAFGVSSSYDRSMPLMHFFLGTRELRSAVLGAKIALKQIQFNDQETIQCFLEFLSDEEAVWALEDLAAVQADGKNVLVEVISM